MKHIILAIAFIEILSQMHPTLAGSCRSRPSGPDIWGPVVQCPTNVWSQRPECDLEIPVHKVSGYLSYWNEFMFPRSSGPCDIVPNHFPAYLDQQEDLENCIEYVCTGNEQEECTHDVLIWPYFANTTNSTKHISKQEQCERRHFTAKGCFVKGTNGRVFVANWIDYYREPANR